MSEQLLSEFGDNLGIDGLVWPASRVVGLEFDQRGTLFLEDLGEEMLVYLVRAIDRLDGAAARLERALRLCHYREGLPFSVQAGLKGEDLLAFVVRLPSRETMLPELERVLEMLTDLHDEVAG